MKWACAAGLVASIFAAERAHAETTRETPEPRDFRLAIGTGAFSDSQSGGFAFEGELLHRRGLLAIGAVGDYGTTLVLRYRYFGGGAGAGISLPTPSWLRVDVLGVATVHRYEGAFGTAIPFLLEDRGVSATLPALGARVGAALEVGGRFRFVIGLKGIVDHDLSRAARTHTASSPWVAPETKTDTIGGTRFGALLTLGTTFEAPEL